MSLDPDKRSKQRTMKVQGKSEINLLTKPAETEPKKVCNSVMIINLL